MTQPSKDEAETGAPSQEEGAPAPAENESDERPEVDMADTENEMARAQEDVAALTADLQRLQAEYLNYKRRVERDRQLVAENAAWKALVPIVDVLDSVDRARQAGEVEGGFAVVADHLQRAVGKSGLIRFGEPGDAFDPNLHEALSHMGEDPDVKVTSVKVVAKAGYKLGDRVVRAAQVLVVDPAAPAPSAPAQESGETPAQQESGESEPGQSEPGQSESGDDAPGA